MTYVKMTIICHNFR